MNVRLGLAVLALVSVTAMSSCKSSAEQRAEQEAARTREPADRDRYNKIAEDQRLANEAAAARRAAMYPDVHVQEAPLD